MIKCLSIIDENENQFHLSLRTLLILLYELISVNTYFNNYERKEYSLNMILKNNYSKTLTLIVGVLLLLLCMGISIVYGYANTSIQTTLESFFILTIQMSISLFKMFVFQEHL